MGVALRAPSERRRRGSASSARGVDRAVRREIAQGGIDELVLLDPRLAVEGALLAVTTTCLEVVLGAGHVGEVDLGAGKGHEEARTNVVSQAWHVR